MATDTSAHPAPAEPGDDTAVGGSRRRRLVLALTGVLLLALGFGVMAARYTFHEIGTAVMTPAVAAGDTVLADTQAAGGHGVRRGDVVLVRSGGWKDDPAGLTYTVRVVGLGGDTVRCCDGQGRLMVNGKSVTEKFAHGDTAAFGAFDVKVPKGRMFVLGDARSISVDSRSSLDDNGGTLPLSSVTGRVEAIAFPLWDIASVPGTGGSSGFPLYLLGVGAILVGLVLELAAGWPVLRRACSWVMSRIPRRRAAQQSW